MLELRREDYSNKALKDKILIHGHVPTNLNIIKEKIKKRTNSIPLDNGCVYTKAHKYHDIKHLGSLCCFNLDTYDLIIQKNIE